jgi:mono/diheme cytochrome c family protein
MRLSAIILPALFSAALASPLVAQNPPPHEHGGAQHPSGGTHHHPEAAKNKNPVAPDAQSIAAGKEIYDKQCAGCHGDTGKGDGAMGSDLNPKPPDLTDAEWKHGSTDGELYLVIHDGAKNTGMKAFGKKLTAHQIWDVINYIRSIGPAKSH